MARMLTQHDREQVDTPMSDSGEFRRGWPVVVAALIGVGLGLSPIPFYEIGLIAPELVRAFGWGFGDVLGGITFLMLGVLIAGPVVGTLADRHGVRRVALTSIVLFSLSLGLFALQSGSLWLYYANWFAMAVAGAGTLPITFTRTINRWFDRRKGLALGLTLTGTGISSAVLKPLTAVVIAGWGWRGAFIFLALLPLLIALPIVWFGFRDAPVAVQSLDAPVTDQPGLTFGQTLQDWRFWIIGVFILFIAFAISGQISNLEIILKSRGADRTLILSTVPFLGLAIIAGRLVGGWLIDLLWAPAVTLVLLTMAAFAAWLLVHGSVSYAVILFSVIGMGMAAGVEFDIVAFLTARYFGTRHYGSIYGVLYAFFAVGSGTAPFIFGRIFDVTKSYESIVNVAVAGLFLPSLLLLLLGRYRYPGHGRRRS